MALLNDIANERQQEWANLCNNKEIGEARNALGYWWMLSEQNVTRERSIYTFHRAGYGRLELTTNDKNIVTKTAYRMFC